MITSPSNPRIRRLVELRDRGPRDRDAVFLVEGEGLIGRAVAAGLSPFELYFDPDRHGEPPFQAESVFPVGDRALDRASYRGRSAGVIALFRQFPVSLDTLHPGPDPLLMVAEAMEKPGNLGALLRTADAAGVDGLIAADPSTDPFNPNVVRASMGALFTVPIAVASLSETVTWLAGKGVRLVTADPAAPDQMWDVDLTGATALLVGAEHVGLSEAARAAADITVSIPMSGSVDSLNTSVAASLLVYESLRQRAGTG